MFSRGGILLPSIYADARYIDAGIVPKALHAYRQTLPDDYARCASFLAEGVHLDCGAFLAWFAQQQQQNSDWIARQDRAGDTLLHMALEKNAPGAVQMALLAAWRGAVMEQNARGKTPLQTAIGLKRISLGAAILAMVAACPKADSTNKVGTAGAAGEIPRWSTYLISLEATDMPPPPPYSVLHPGDLMLTRLQISQLVLTSSFVRLSRPKTIIILCCTKHWGIRPAQPRLWCEH